MTDRNTAFRSATFSGSHKNRRRPWVTTVKKYVPPGVLALRYCIGVTHHFCPLKNLHNCRVSYLNPTYQSPYLSPQGKVSIMPESRLFALMAFHAANGGQNSRFVCPPLTRIRSFFIHISAEWNLFGPKPANVIWVMGSTLERRNDLRSANPLQKVHSTNSPTGKISAPACSISAKALLPSSGCIFTAATASRSTTTPNPCRNPSSTVALTQ